MPVQSLNFTASQPLNRAPRRVRHLQHIRHVAGGTDVENRVRDAVDRRLDLKDARLQRARVERNRLARLQIDAEVRMARTEILKQGHQPRHIVIRARDVVAAAEVDPFHLRQQVAELRLEARQHLAQLFHTLLAETVEVEAVEKVEG